MSRGQIAYEADVKRKPLYHDGKPRKLWAELHEVARRTWERDYPEENPCTCVNPGTGVNCRC